MAKPRDLALAVAPGVALGRFHRGRQIDLADEMAQQPGHAVRLHGGQRRIEAPAAQRLHFRKRAGAKHALEARIDARVKLRALDAEGLKVENLQLHQPTLDDVFLAKTGRSLEGSDEEEEEATPGEVAVEAA